MLPTLIRRYTIQEQKTIVGVWDRCDTKPEKFIGVLATFSVAKDPRLMFEEWIAYGLPYEAGQCICSQYIKHCYPFINKKNGSILVIGSECISKFGDEGMKEKQKIMKSIALYKGDKRMCESCLNYRISSKKDSYVTKCKPCWKESVEVNPSFVEVCYRPCCECQKPINPNLERCLLCQSIQVNEYVKRTINSKSQQVILPSFSLPVEEHIKNRCSSCQTIVNGTYKYCYNCHLRNITSKENYRQCNTCRIHNIPKIEPSYKKDCLQCWMKKNTAR